MHVCVGLANFTTFLQRYTVMASMKLTSTTTRKKWTFFPSLYYTSVQRCALFKTAVGIHPVMACTEREACDSVPVNSFTIEI